MKSMFVLLVVTGLAGSAAAANVEFRIVERDGSNFWNGMNTVAPSATQDNAANKATNNIFNFSIQARVTGASASTNVFLGAFGFNIVSDDLKGNGVLSRLRMSQAVRDQDTGEILAWNNWVANSNNHENNTVGEGGLSHLYSYVAGVSASFNGVFNSDFGGWTTSPTFNDIGSVAGFLLGTPLLDVINYGGTDPLSYTGGNTAPVTSERSLLGGDGNWIDVYRFNYTSTSNSSRTISFTITDPIAQTFSQYGRAADGTWGMFDPTDATTSTGFHGTWRLIVPAPSGIVVIGIGGVFAARRRRSN